MPTVENYLRTKVQNLEMELTRLQRDFERLRNVAGAGNSNYVKTNTRLNTGQGLIGGGSLSSDRTLSVSLRTNSGLRFDPSGGGLYIDSSAIPSLIAGQGLQSTAGTLAVWRRTSNSGLAFENNALYVNTGDGLGFNQSGAVIVRTRTTNSGLAFENGQLYVDVTNLINVVAGDGLFSSNGILNVKPGNLISINQSQNSVQLALGGASQYISTLNSNQPNNTTPAWRNLSALAGSGLSYDSPSDSFRIGAGNLITVETTSVRISSGTNVNGHQVIATPSNSQTGQWTNLSTYAGAGLGFSFGKFVVSTNNVPIVSGITRLLNPLSTGQTVVDVYDRIYVSGDRVYLETPGQVEDLQITNAGTSITGGWRYTVIRNIDGSGQNNWAANDFVTLRDFGIYVAPDGNTTLRYSNNPGRSSQILASAPDGGLLTLANLDIRQVTNFEQGTGNFRVLNTNNVPIFDVNTSRLNVGINTGLTGPDLQFALDVNGPLRATYLIGPHAIQIEKLSMIAHFDGANENGPFGESNGHMGQIGSKNGGVFFYREPYARFNKAVGFALNSINYIKNPSFEFDQIIPNVSSATGWTAGFVSGGSGNPKINTVNTFYFIGDKSCQIPKNVYAQTDTGQGYIGAIATGNVFYAQVRVFRLNPLGTVSLSITRNNNVISSTTVSLVTNNSDGGGEWEHLWTSWTSNVSENPSNIGIRIENSSGLNIYVDAAQLEINAFNPYFDGSLGGYSNNERVFSGSPSTAWQGVAHNSNSLTHPAMPSSENNQRFISYNTNRTGIITSVGSVFAWVHILDIRTSSAVNYFEIARTFEVKDQNSAYDNSLVIRVASTGALQVYILDILFTANIPGGLSSWLRKWCFVTVTWEQGVFRLYFNGTLVKTHQAFFEENLFGETSFTDSEGNEQNSLFSGFSEVEGDFTTLQSVPAMERFANTIRVGPGRGFIDEFGIVQRALPADEVRSIYESNAPVFAETSTFNFRPTPDGLVWADDRGLWVQRKDGKPAFGIFAGSDPTYTWGGIPLNQGDVLIGGTPNYMRFQPDIGKLVINAQKQTGSGAGVGFVLDSEEGISIRIPQITLNETPLGINSYSFVENTTQVASMSLFRSNQNRTLLISTVDNTPTPITSPLSLTSSSIVIAPGQNNPLTLRTNKGGAFDLIQMTPNQTGTSPGDNEILIKTFGNLRLQSGDPNNQSNINMLSTGIINVNVQPSAGKIYLWTGSPTLSDTLKTEIYNDPAANSRPRIDIKTGRITSTQNNNAGIEVGTSFMMSSSNFVPGVTGFFLGDRRATALQDVLIQANWDGTFLQPGSLNIRTNSSAFFRRHNGTTPLIAQLSSGSTSMDVRDAIFYAGSTATIGSPEENITINDFGESITGGRRYIITRGTTPGTYASGTNVTGRASTTTMIVGKSEFESSDQTTQVEFYRPIGLRPQILNTVTTPAYPFVRMYIIRNSVGDALLVFALKKNASNLNTNIWYSINLSGGSNAEPT